MLLKLNIFNTLSKHKNTSIFSALFSFQVLCVLQCNHCFLQINDIKERVKSVSSLERDIKKYMDDGREEYKEVICSLILVNIHLHFLALIFWKHSNRSQLSP